MIKVIYNKVCGRCVQSEPLTSGMVGQPIEFEYSADFDGLAVTAVFTDGKNTVDVVNPGNECIIPHEVLTTVGVMVKVGIYAVRGNELVIPTVYATIGVVQKGADPSGDVSVDPTLPVWAQTQAMIGNLNDLDTEAKNNLVAAINEAAQSGGGGGSSIALDTTLTQSGKAADAKAVGDALAGKQDTISDLEAIRTGASKGATALQSVPSTYRTASEQDTIDSGKVDKVIGKGLSSNDYTDAAKAKVDALAPVATSGSYNDLTNKPTIPTALPNPNALTFTGAVTGSYDGSVPLTVNIPAGGGGGSSDNWELINTITVSDDATTNVTFTQDSAGNPFALKKLYLKISGIKGATTYPAIRLNGLNWTQQFNGGNAGGAANITMSVLFELLGNGIYIWEWANPHYRDIRRTGERISSGGVQSLIETINSVMWTWGTGSAITNGSVFTLYGARA